MRPPGGVGEVGGGAGALSIPDALRPKRTLPLRDGFRLLYSMSDLPVALAVRLPDSGRGKGRCARIWSTASAVLSLAIASVPVAGSDNASGGSGSAPSGGRPGCARPAAWCRPAAPGSATSATRLRSLPSASGGVRRERPGSALSVWTERRRLIVLDASRAASASSPTSGNERSVDSRLRFVILVFAHGGVNR